MSTSEADNPGPSGLDAGPPQDTSADERVVCDSEIDGGRHAGLPQDTSSVSETDDEPTSSDSEIDDGPIPTVLEAHANKRTKGRYFGMPKNRSVPVYLRPDDYEQKYPPDDIEEALGPNARVWRVYLDEAQAFDSNMIEGWKDTIDVLLVFAGLFSAVVTTFVVQTSQNLQPDYSEISALLLSELVGLQRATAEGRPLASVPLSSKNATSFVAQKSDQWINGLWFTSLALSLATALMSVLVKQWLQYYMMPVSGTSQEQVHVRQFRYTGMKLWHVEGIIGCLPVLMHLALLLFCIGLVILVIQLNKGIAIAVAIVAGLAYIGYFATNIWAVIDVQCPYKTLLSNSSRLLLEMIRPKIYRMWSKLRKILKLQKIHFYIHRYHNVMYKATISVALLEEHYVQMHENLLIEKKVIQINENLFIEKNIIQKMTKTLDIDALVWLSTISSNLSIPRIVYYSLAALDLNKHNAITLLSQPTIKHFYSNDVPKILKNDNSSSHEVYNIFWADMMNFATHSKYKTIAGEIMKNNRLQYPINETNYNNYGNILTLFSFSYFPPNYETTIHFCDSNDKILLAFEKILQKSTTQDWLWKRALHIITHILQLKNLQLSELVHVGLLSLKSEHIWKNKKVELTARSAIILENLYFLLKPSFLVASPTVLSTILSTDKNMTKAKIFLLYFENIDKWIDYISEADIDLLISIWLDYWPYEFHLFHRSNIYLEQSIRLLNCSKVYKKLTQSKIKEIIIEAVPYILFISETRSSSSTIFTSLNESFLYALCNVEEEMFTDVEYCKACLHILNYSAKFDFWYNHNIMTIISHMPIHERLWKLINKFISCLYKQVSYNPSDEFLDWYCKLFLKHLDRHTNPHIIYNSKFLELMDHSLEHPIWTEFLASVIKEYNERPYQERYETMPSCSDSNCSYFDQLIYLSQMKKRLNVSSTDSKFILYAYISGAEIEELKFLDKSQYAPYSFIFEFKHICFFKSEDESSYSQVPKPQSVSLAFKAIQKAFRIGRTSNQMEDTQLSV